MKRRGGGGLTERERKLVLPYLLQGVRAALAVEDQEGGGANPVVYVRETPSKES